MLKCTHLRALFHECNRKNSSELLQHPSGFPVNSTKTAPKRLSTKPFDSSHAISFLKAHSAMLLRMVPFVSLASASFFKEDHLGLLTYLFFGLASNWHGTVGQYKWECFTLEPQKCSAELWQFLLLIPFFGLSHCYTVVSKCREADLPFC